MFSITVIRHIHIHSNIDLISETFVEKIQYKDNYVNVK